MAEAILIDGKAKAAQITATVTAEAAELLRRSNLRPGLAVVLIGADPASQVYVKNKAAAADRCGFRSEQHNLAPDVPLEQVLSLIGSLNDDAGIHGILVQLPLPDHLDEQRITQAIDPRKDVDGFHYQNIGRLAAGHAAGTFVPCTPAGCMLLIEDRHGSDLGGLLAVVIGRSNIVGKPVANLLLQRNATVTICHSKSPDLPDIARRADVLVVAVGRPAIVKADWIKPGATVIDVGITRVETEVEGKVVAKLSGDVDFAAALQVAGAITPVPGGVGPMTIAMLMANTLQGAKAAAASGN